ncbi:MAG: DNA-3-methyladenine glycosylase 2 family protein [Alphaproteobacteria bacterium]|nr:DNA-3-methyladenine glycosylase 2 family protein [Alphaproteobacteria bacterium]
MTNAANERRLTSTKPVLAETIDSAAILERHLAGLVAADPRLAPVLAGAGTLRPRREPGGFAGMARIVNAQMLSVQSAAAIHARFLALFDHPDAAALAAIADERLRAAGLSGAKIAALRHLAAAEGDGRLDYAALPSLPAEKAIAMLTAIGGIGRWTAEIYLLFCTGHPDILPAGDLALRKAAQWALGLAEAPGERQLRAIAEAWSPWRGAAAHLLWRHYALLRKREGIIG